MKIFFDTEFIEDGRTIELLSIGMVREDGEEFYGEANWTDKRRANDWVKEHVLPNLTGPDYSREDMAYRIRQFAGDKPEFWAYYADYDWVVLCQLFGTMMDLPDGWSMYCRDFKQWLDANGNPEMSQHGAMHHNAIADARWLKDNFYRLRTKKGARGKYAPLDTLLKAVKPTLQKHNLLIRQGQERSHGADDGGTKTRIYPVYTDIIHWPSGQMHRTTIDVPTPKLDAQGVGSAITYGKRYSLLAALGIATDDDVADDDGQAGRKRDITDQIAESKEFAALKAVIDQCVAKGDLATLKSFQVGEAGHKLSDEEFGALRTYWLESAEKLKSAS